MLRASQALRRRRALSRTQEVACDASRLCDETSISKCRPLFSWILSFWRLRISFQWCVIYLWRKIRLSWGGQGITLRMTPTQVAVHPVCKNIVTHVCLITLLNFSTHPPFHPLRLRWFLFCRAGGTVWYRSCAFRLIYVVLFHDIYIFFHFEWRQRKKLKQWCMHATSTFK